MDTDLMKTKRIKRNIIRLIQNDKKYPPKHIYKELSFRMNILSDTLLVLLNENNMLTLNQTCVIADYFGCTIGELAEEV